jgi:hypothetical protein
VENGTIAKVQDKQTPMTEMTITEKGKADDSQAAVKPDVAQETAAKPVATVPSATNVASSVAVDGITAEEKAEAPTQPEQIVAAGITAVPAQPGDQGEEVLSYAAVPQPDVREKAAAPSVADRAASVEEPEPRSSTGNTLYRGPQDQLIHARNLADVRKFWESEQVLKDLLSQTPPASIQEEASLLLVKVLSNQNRVTEAQRILDSAKGQFPASEMIQTFELEPEGDRPVQ